MPGFILIIPEVPRPLHLVESVSGMLGDLLVGSTPDLDGGYRYQGAPIGYSCKKVAHKDGFEEVFSGNEHGPRGIYLVMCAGYGGCARCDRKLTRDMSHYYVCCSNKEGTIVRTKLTELSTLYLPYHW